VKCRRQMIFRAPREEKPGAAPPSAAACAVARRAHVLDRRASGLPLERRGTLRQEWWDEGGWSLLSPLADALRMEGSSI
jgi:hypothetical protein